MNVLVYYARECVFGVCGTDQMKITMCMHTCTCVLTVDSEVSTVDSEVSTVDSEVSTVVK